MLHCYVLFYDKRTCVQTADPGVGIGSYRLNSLGSRDSPMLFVALPLISLSDCLSWNNLSGTIRCFIVHFKPRRISWPTVNNSKFDRLYSITQGSDGRHSAVLQRVLDGWLRHPPFIQWHRRLFRIISITQHPSPPGGASNPVGFDSFRTESIETDTLRGAADLRLSCVLVTCASCSSVDSISPTSPAMHGSRRESAGERVPGASLCKLRWLIHDDDS